MKKQIFAVAALAVLLGIAQTVSSNAVSSKRNLTASVIAASDSEWYDYGYADGAYDRAQGNPYQTSFNPPADRDDRKEYQLGYLAGFDGGN
jgi:hypothetical protein